MISDGHIQRVFETLRVEARANKAAAPTVAAVAARSGVSRSSLYRFHPQIVAQIHALRENREIRKQDQFRLKAQYLAKQLKAEKQLTSALARACAELAAEKIAMKELFEDERLSFQLKLEHLEKKLRGAKLVRMIDAP
jgi:hypothetical protein